MTLKRTPLFDAHIALHAKMVPFGGWEMPVQYGSIIEEYQQTRQQTALFDICHMGEFIIEGDAVSSGLDRIVTQRLVDLPINACRYGMMLNEQGGVIDDLIVFRLGQEKWMAVVNAGTLEKDVRHFQNELSPAAKFSNISDATGKIDVQGPASRDFLKPLVEEIENLQYYTFGEFSLGDYDVIVSRTGYTGELGYEIYCPWDRTPGLWDRLLKMGAKPAGLGARDMLRIEMGYSLYGHEISEEISPLDAGLDRFIDWEKEFIGKPALSVQKQKGKQRKIICFAADSRRAPRAEQMIFSEQGKAIGVVTSGTFSPALTQGVGLGFVPCDVKVDDHIFFGKESDRISARVMGRPIYKSGSLKR